MIILLELWWSHFAETSLDFVALGFFDIVHRICFEFLLYLGVIMFRQRLSIMWNSRFEHWDRSWFKPICIILPILLFLPIFPLILPNVPLIFISVFHFILPLFHFYFNILWKMIKMMLRIYFVIFPILSP